MADLKKLEEQIEKFQAFLNLDDNILGEFIIDLLKTPLGGEANNSKIDIIKKGSCKRSIVDGKTEEIRWCYYDEFLINMNGIHYVPEHGGQVPFITTHQILTIIDFYQAFFGE